MPKTVQEFEAELESASSPIEKIDLLNKFARSLSDVDPQQGLAFSQRAHKLAQIPPPYTSGIYSSLINLSLCNLRLGHLEKALKQAMRAYGMAETQNSLQPSPLLFNLLGALFQDLGEYKQSIDFYLQALDLVSDQDASKEIVTTLTNLGIVFHFLNDYPRELAHYEKAMELQKQLGSQQTTAALLNNMAMAHRAMGDLDTAVAKAEESLCLARELDLTMVEANTLCTLGELYLDKQDIPQAISNLEASAALANSLGFRYVEAYSFRKIGETLLQEDTPQEAVDALQKALQIADSLRNQAELSACHHALAQSYKRLGNFSQALHHFEKFHALDKNIYQEKADRHVRQLQIVHETKTIQQEARIYKQRSAELDAYARSVAHDLKHPMAAILGYSELLTDLYADQLPENFPTSILTKMAESAEIASQTIDALLLLATVDITEVQLKSIDMETAVNNVLLRLEPMIEQCQGRVILPDEWETAVGYLPWVEEVWANYLSNSLKYGGKTPTITLSCEPYSTNMIRFWVTDDGPGIPDEIGEKLFNEFKRPRQPQDKNSHGLGLAIVQRIVEKLGGTVGYKSEPDDGSQFFFTLPRSHINPGK